MSTGAPRLLTSVRARPVTAARRLTKRAFRAVDRAFLVEGPQGVREALGTDAGLTTLFATDEAARRHEDLVSAARAGGAEVHLVSGEVLGSLAATVTPQGLVGVAPLRHVPLSTDVRLAVVLAAVRDPGNAGTVVRVADAAGADAVVFSTDSVDPYNGKCVRASAGSIFHVPFTVDAALDTALPALRAAGVRVLAADGAGAADLDEVAARGDLAGPTAWLFGNEAWGLPAAVSALADQTVRVPIYGRAESLNLATAAAVCLYASARAQRAVAAG